VIAAKFHSLDVEESENLERLESESELGVGILESRSRESGSETLERSELESDILPTTSQPCL